MINSFHLVQELISLQVTLDICHRTNHLKEVEKEFNRQWDKDQIEVIALKILTDYKSKDRVKIHEIKVNLVKKSITLKDIILQLE